MGEPGLEKKRGPATQTFCGSSQVVFAAEATRARSVHASEQKRRALRTGGLRLGLHKAVTNADRTRAPLLKRDGGRSSEASDATRVAVAKLITITIRAPNRHLFSDHARRL